MLDIIEVVLAFGLGFFYIGIIVLLLVDMFVAYDLWGKWHNKFAVGGLIWMVLVIIYTQNI